MKLILKNSSLVFQTNNIDPSAYIRSTENADNSVYDRVITDTNGKILWGRYADGSGTYEPDLSGVMISGTSASIIVNSVKKTF